MSRLDTQDLSQAVFYARQNLEPDSLPVLCSEVVCRHFAGVFSAFSVQFGFKKWKSHVTKRPLDVRSDIVKTLYEQPKKVKPFVRK